MQDIRSYLFSDLFKLVLEASTLGIHGACTSTKESENASRGNVQKEPHKIQNFEIGATSEQQKSASTGRPHNNKTKYFAHPLSTLPSSPPPTPQRAMSTATLTATPQELFVTPTKPQRQAKDEVATPVDEPVRAPLAQHARPFVPLKSSSGVAADRPPGPLRA